MCDYLPGMAGGVVNMTELTKLLECPVCLKTMKPPILQCNSGHNICYNCEAELEVCPVCREKFIGVRNKFAEQMAMSVIYPCPYSRLGCDVKTQLDTMADHSAECKFALYKCQVHCFVSQPCQWENSLSDLPLHVKENHPHFFKVQDHDHNSFVELCLSEVKQKAYLISAHNELFWCHAYPDPEKKLMFIAVQVLGIHPGKARHFSWQIRFDSPTEETVSLTYSGLPVHSIADHFWARLVTKPRDCAVLHYASLVHFAQDLTVKNLYTGKLKISTV